MSGVQIGYPRTFSSLDPIVIGAAYYKTPLRDDGNGVDSDEVVVCIGAECHWR